MTQRWRLDDRTARRWYRLTVPVVPTQPERAERAKRRGRVWLGLFALVVLGLLAVRRVVSPADCSAV